MFLSLVHFISVSSSVSYPCLIKFHDFVDNSQEGDEASNERCNSGPKGHDFTDNNFKSKNVRFEPGDPDLVIAWDICNIYK